LRQQKLYRQLTVLYLVALDFATKLDTISKDKLETLVKHLWDLPVKVTECLKQAGAIEKIAKEFHAKKQFIYLARNLNYPIALEGALKLKEILILCRRLCRRRDEHGPIALIDETMPVMVIATKSKIYEKV
jgi:glucosamine--fructose-6-phosphate aminotransferase (isomerizing)